MIKIFTVLIFLFSFYGNAQILDEYPKNQEFYEGGISNFYKEIHEVLTKNSTSECNPEEIYQPRIIVTKEETVKIITDSDTENIAKNKCAYDISMSIIKKLKHWKAAEIKGEKISAVTEFIIYPKDLMSAYKNNYNPFRLMTTAQYPNGMKAFNEKFHDNFMSLFTDYQINGRVNLEFYISKEGQIVNARIFPLIENRKFNIEFLRTLSRLNKPWKPALYSNIPIKQRFTYPIQFYTSFEAR